MGYISARDTDSSTEVVDPREYTSDAQTTESTGSSYDDQDPFDDGKTGSEVMAEHGDPSAVVTIDPSVESVAEKVREDGAEATAQTFVDLAQDGSDPNGSASFNFAGREVSVSTASEDLAGVADMFRNIAIEDTIQSAPEVVDDAVEKARGMGDSTLLLLAAAVTIGIGLLVGGES